MTSDSGNKSNFEKAAGQRREGLFSDMLAFFGENKKWWMLPIVFSLIIVGALVILTATGAGPFVYTLF